MSYPIGCDLRLRTHPCLLLHQTAPLPLSSPSAEGRHQVPAPPRGGGGGGVPLYVPLNPLCAISVSVSVATPPRSPLRTLGSTPSFPGSPIRLDLSPLSAAVRLQRHLARRVTWLSGNTDHLPCVLPEADLIEEAVEDVERPLQPIRLG